MTQPGKAAGQSFHFHIPSNCFNSLYISAIIVARLFSILIEQSTLPAHGVPPEGGRTPDYSPSG
jgi:hypothetical protein